MQSHIHLDCKSRPNWAAALGVAIPDPLGLQSWAHLCWNLGPIWVPIPDPSGCNPKPIPLQFQTHLGYSHRPIRDSNLGAAALQSPVHLCCNPNPIPFAIPTPFLLQSQTQQGSKPESICIAMPDPFGLQSQNHSCWNPAPTWVAVLDPFGL